MKLNGYRLLFGAIGVLIALFPGTIQSCPVCFSSATENVLHTYYISAIFLSLLPFGVVALIATYVIRSHRKSEEQISGKRGQ